MAPWECEVAVGTGHFEACIKYGVKNQENGADLGGSVFGQSVDVSGQGVVGAKEGDEQEQTKENQSRRGCLYMHHIVDPIVIDGIVEHARPEGGKQGLPATESV